MLEGDCYAAEEENLAKNNGLLENSLGPACVPYIESSHASPHKATYAKGPIYQERPDMTTCSGVKKLFPGGVWLASISSP